MIPPLFPDGPQLQIVGRNPGGEFQTHRTVVDHFFDVIHIRMDIGERQTGFRMRDGPAVASGGHHLPDPVHFALTGNDLREMVTLELHIPHVRRGHIGRHENPGEKCPVAAAVRHGGEPARPVEVRLRGRQSTSNAPGGFSKSVRLVFRQHRQPGGGDGFGEFIHIAVIDFHASSFLW